MSMTTEYPQRAIPGAPQCFGKEWNNNEPECAGGPDYSFKDEEGKHVRPRCGFFSACSAATAASRQPLITPQSMIRPQPSIHLPPVQQPPSATTFTPQPPPGMPPRPAWTPPVMHPPVAPASMTTDWRAIEQQRQAGLAARALPPPAYLAPQPTQLGPASVHYPVTTWQVGNAMPAYLTHEEERRPGESWFIPLLFTLVRGMLKAFGHS